MRIALKLTLNITRRKADPAPEPEPLPEQREAALDAMVIPADDRGPHELDAERRPDSYGFMDSGQAIGFSRRVA